MGVSDAPLSLAAFGGLSLSHKGRGNTRLSLLPLREKVARSAGRGALHPNLLQWPALPSIPLPALP
ncbi:hypothetical protein GCM10025759_22620 [Lysobacter panacisoli]|uniref:Uncharacterized protein n=1 Tax=Lysobacter panacisoli TaxID=1255263 RepID=A0ABP9LF18_9GAMM